MVDISAGSQGVNLAQLISAIQPILLGTGKTTGTGSQAGTSSTSGSSSSSTFNSFDPNTLSALLALASGAANNAQDPSRTQGVVNDIFRQATEAFAPIVGNAASTGLYNTTALQGLKNKSIADATSAASAAVLNYQTSQQQIAANTLGTIAAGTKTSTTSGASTQTSNTTNNTYNTSQTAPAAGSSLMSTLGLGIAGLAGKALLGSDFVTNHITNPVLDYLGNPLGLGSKAATSAATAAGNPAIPIASNAGVSPGNISVAGVAPTSSVTPAGTSSASALSTGTGAAGGGIVGAGGIDVANSVGGLPSVPQTSSIFSDAAFSAPAVGEEVGTLPSAVQTSSIFSDSAFSAPSSMAAQDLDLTSLNLGAETVTAGTGGAGELASGAGTAFGLGGSTGSALGDAVPILGPIISGIMGINNDPNGKGGNQAAGATGGAAIGALFGPIGVALGSAIGSLVGSVFGPAPPSAYGDIRLNAGSNGLVNIKSSNFQNVPIPQQQEQAYTEQSAGLNKLMQSYGFGFGKDYSNELPFSLGYNTPGKTADPNKFYDLNTANASGETAFSRLSFAAPGNQQLNTALAGKSFNTAQDLYNTLQSSGIQPSSPIDFGNISSDAQGLLQNYHQSQSDLLASYGFNINNSYQAGASGGG